MRKILAIFLPMLCACLLSFGQQREVTGKVTDGEGKPIDGASVLLKGTSNGTSTSSDGSYKITVPQAGGTLVFSFQGFSNEYAIGNRGILNATINVGGKGLEEIVVVGYGTQRKKDVTGNMASVKGAVVADKPVQSFDQALAGRASGVQISSPNGVLNSPPVFRIRGTNSISLSSYPLIVVDGVPVFTGDVSSAAAAGNALASINPSDIESMEIAKDAAATAIYGSRAANGVVFITTKKGRSGKAKVAYNTWVSFAKPFRLPELLNAREYIAFKSSAVANNPSASAIRYNMAADANGDSIDTRWSDYVYRKNAFSHNHNINVTGGGENANYYMSLGYTNQEGIIRANNFERISGLLNADAKLGSVLTVGTKLSYSNERNLAATSSGSVAGAAFNTGGLGRLSFVLPPILAPYKNDGSYNLNGAAIGSANISGISNLSYYNPEFLINKNKSNSENNRIQGNVFAQLKLWKPLTLRTSFGIDNLMVDNDIFWSPLSGDGFSYGGYAWSGASFYKTSVWTNTAQLDFQPKDIHNINLLLGTELQKSRSRGYGLQSEGILDVDLQDIQSGYITTNATNLLTGENNLISIFSRLNYNYDNRYYLSANLRQDEYSALAVKKGTFWGVSAGWEIAKEKFWSEMNADKIFSSFRLRGSYGKVGNIGGIGDFASFSLFSPTLYGGSPAQTFSQVASDNLRWETSKKLDVGVNMGFLNNRLAFSATYYKNKIDGLILYVQQAPSTGLPTNPPLNAGTMENKGWEFELQASPLKPQSAVQWNSSFNISFNDNMVKSLAPGLTYILTSTSTLETVNRTQAGHPIGMLWVVRTNGVDPTTGKRIYLNSAGTPVYYQYYAASGTYNYSTQADGTVRYVGPTSTSINQSADAVMYANPNPKYYGGWDNTFRFKNIELNVLTTFQGGNYIYYGSNAGLHDQRWWNNHADVLTDAWQAPGNTGKKYARPVYGDNVSNGSAFPLDINVFKGDFVKLKTITLAYNFNRDFISKASISNLRLYVSAQNAAFFTKYPGPDPEVSSNGNITSAPGVDRNTGANAQTVVIGANISF